MMMRAGLSSDFHEPFDVVMSSQMRGQEQEVTRFAKDLSPTLRFDCVRQAQAGRCVVGAHTFGQLLTRSTRPVRI